MLFDWPRSYLSPSREGLTLDMGGICTVDRTNPDAETKLRRGQNNEMTNVIQRKLLRMVDAVGDFCARRPLPGWLIPLLLASYGGVLILAIRAAPQAPQTQTWFTAKSGGTTCTVKKVFQTPMKVSWVCTNQYGGISGSYSADPTGGVNGVNWFYMGVNSLSGNLSPQIASNLSCLIGMNATSGPFALISLDGFVGPTFNNFMIPANSAAYLCSGFTTAGNGIISWP
jgi:hypothetical protein